MDWIEVESFGFYCASFADERLGREAFDGLQSLAEIVGADEVVEVAFELRMAVVVAALHDRVFYRAVHPFDPRLREGGLWPLVQV